MSYIVNPFLMKLLRKKYELLIPKIFDFIDPVMPELIRDLKPNELVSDISQVIRDFNEFEGDLPTAINLANVVLDLYDPRINAEKIK